MQRPDHISQLLDIVQDAFDGGTLISFKLTSYEGDLTDLKSIDIKKISIKSGEKFSLTSHFKTNDIVKNLSPAEARTFFENALRRDFRNAILKTQTQDCEFFRIGEKTKLKRKDVAGREAPTSTHNRAKNHALIDTNKHWLKALGICGQDGKVRNKSQDKFRQINKMVEIFAPLIEKIGGDTPRIVDMGAGKGYLDFALAEYFSHIAPRAVEILGVELRPQLVKDSNEIAHKSGFDCLKFEAGTIANWKAQADAVIALHACDTATDDAIFKGIQADASLIAVAPCCHKQIRKDMAKGQADTRLEMTLRHGIFMERQAEMATDSLRGLLLELHGYRVKLFDFISDAHTPKNILIVAEKDERNRRDPNLVRQQITDTKDLFGITTHYLETLLS